MKKRFDDWFCVAVCSLVVPLTVALLGGCSDDVRANDGGAGGTPSGSGAGGAGAGASTCEPNGQGPHWVLETEPLAFEIVCDTGAEFDGADFELDGLPAGAAFDTATRTVSFTPGLDQADVYLITVRVVSTGETTTVKLGVADKWDDPANVPVLSPSTYTEEYGLPVLFLTPGPVTEQYAPASITYGGHTYAAEAKLRGAASLSYPKNSYTLKFPDADAFSDAARGFEDKRKVVLISTFDDNSYVRQRLAYDLWNRMDPGHIQIQAYSAVVFLDGEYYGLYTVADHVDRFLMESHGLSEDGNLYKAVNHDGNFDTVSFQQGGAPKQTLHDGYEKKEGTPLDGEALAYADLEELVSFVATSDDATFLAELDDRIDSRDYVDWFVFVTFIMADDSAGKNSYHYHDPLDPSGRWRYAPWDFNASFGQAWTTHREAAEVPTDYVQLNRMFERFLELPTLAGPLEARYRAQLDSAFSSDSLLATIDAYAAEIDASAKRDEGKWAAQYQAFPWWSDRNDFTDYEGELVYLKQWLAARWTFQSASYP